MAVESEIAFVPCRANEFAIRLHDPALRHIGKVRGHDLADDLRLHCGVLDLDQRFHPAGQVAAHPVGRGHENARLLVRQPVAIAEADDAGVFQEPSYNGFHADVFAQPFDAGAQAADAAYHAVDLHAGLTGLVEGVDHVRLDQRIHLEPDLCRFAGPCVLGFGGDHFEHLRFQRMRRDAEVLQTVRQGIPRQVVEHLGGIAAQSRVTGEEAQIGIDGGRDRMVISGAVMGIGHKPLAFAAHHDRDLGMGFPVQKPIDHMGTRPFQPPRLTDVGGFVEPGLEFHQCRDRFAVLRRFAERRHDRRLTRGAVERLLDRDNVRIARGLRQEPHHHVKGLVGVVQKHVFLLDRSKHVAVEILNPFGHARGKDRPQQVRPTVEHQFLEVRRTDHAGQFDHIVVAHAQFAHNRFAQRLRSASRDRQAHDFTPTPPFERHLEFPHEVFGLILDLDIAVAQHAEPEMVAQLVAGKQPVEMQQEHVLKEQEPLCTVATGQGHEPRHLRRDRQKGLQSGAILASFQLQREAVSVVRDKRERVCRINGQRRQHREDLVEEDVLEMGQIIGIQIVARQDRDAFGLHLCA